MQASFAFERRYWDQDISWVAGLDEVGMGAWAGPVVAGAVVFDRKTVETLGAKAAKTKVVIRDSKQLTPEQRQRSAEWIRRYCLVWAVAEASVEEIHELNILQASHLAMRRAVEQLKTQPSLLLIDGRPAQPHPSIPAESIIKGDSLVFSIAAASILAKVHRDTLMEAWAQEYPVYGFERHKGYGTHDHLLALQTFGACPIHRVGYAPVARSLTSLLK